MTQGSAEHLRLHQVRQYLRRNMITRQLGTNANRFLARAVFFNPPPRVLVNSVPKAGTHLVVSLLNKVPRMMSSGRHHTFRHFGPPGAPATHEQDPLEVNWKELKKAFASVRQGQFITGHFGGHKQLFGILENLDYRTLLVMRDPRDIAVSSAFYFSSEPRHYLYERFSSEFPDMDARLMAVITGMPSTSESRSLEGIGSLIRRYLPWLSQPQTYLVAFERLVGSHGGGSPEEQLAEAQSIVEHINRPMKGRELERVARKTWTSKASTFRRGQKGDWRNHFKEEHIRAFKKLGGQELVTLGYEENLDW